MNERDLSLASHFSWESWKTQPNVLTHHQEGGHHLLAATICKGFGATAILDSSVLIYPSFVVTGDTPGIKPGALHMLDKRSNTERFLYFLFLRQAFTKFSELSINCLYVPRRSWSSDLHVPTSQLANIFNLYHPGSKYILVHNSNYIVTSSRVPD